MHVPAVVQTHVSMQYIYSSSAMCASSRHSLVVKFSVRLLHCSNESADLQTLSSDVAQCAESVQQYRLSRFVGICDLRNMQKFKLHALCVILISVIVALSCNNILDCCIA